MKYIIAIITCKMVYISLSVLFSAIQRNCMALQWEELWIVKADKTDFRQNLKNIFENYPTHNTKEVQLNIT
jgi:hypothetical protein